MASLIPSGSASGTGSMTLSAPVTNSNQTATLPDATGTVMVSGNMPAFSAYLSANQSVSSGVTTKVALNTKSFDTANAFDSTTNYRFTPLVAGYYQFVGCAGPYATNNTSGTSFIYKNGSSVAQGGGAVTSINGSQYIPVSTIVFMNGSTDYVELYGTVTGTASTLFATNSGTTAYLTGALIRTS